MSKIFAIRLVLLPLIYVFLMGILPFVFHWDNFGKFIQVWHEVCVGSGLVIFGIIYSLILIMTMTRAQVMPAKFDMSTPLSSAQEIGINGMPLQNGLDPSGNYMGLSSSDTDYKY